MTNRLICGLAVCLVSGLALVGLQVSAYAQDAAAPESAKKTEPTTAVEKFTARKGLLLVKDIYTVGTAGGESAFGSLKIRQLVVYAPGAADAERVYGVRFERPAMGDYELDQVGFLDFDECKALLEALAFIRELATRMASETHEYTEVAYETRGGMRFGFYQSVEMTGPVSFVNVGGLRTVFTKTDGLAQVRALVEQAVDGLRDKGAK